MTLTQYSRNMSRYIAIYWKKKEIPDWKIIINETDNLQDGLNRMIKMREKQINKFED